MRIVIKVGGSAIAPSLESRRFKEYADVIKSLAKDHTVLVVVGGGTPAREYINVSKELKASNALRDLIGIGVSRLNARLLISAWTIRPTPSLPEITRRRTWPCTQVRSSSWAALRRARPTDAVAAILAEYVHADLLIRTTSVDGVYTADPNVDKTAKKIDHMTPQQLLELVTRMEMMAGANNIFDMLGAQIVKRSHIPMVVVNGQDAHNIIEAINGKPIGTLIK